MFAVLTKHEKYHYNGDMHSKAISNRQYNVHLLFTRKYTKTKSYRKNVYNLSNVNNRHATIQYAGHFGYLCYLHAIRQYAGHLVCFCNLYTT